MRLTEAQLKEIWRRQTSRATPRQAECPTEEHFVRAVTGEMDRQDRARMASHLVACSDCAEEYRILRSLRPLAEQVKASLAASAAQAVHEIGSKLRHERTAAEPASPWQRPAALFSPARLAFAFVTLILISLALGLWLVLLRQRNDREIAQLNRELAERDRALTAVRESFDETRKRLEETIRRSEQEKLGGDSKRYEGEITRLRQSIDELSRPQLDAPIVDLYPSIPIRGNTTGDAKKVEPPPTANYFTLILNVAGQPLASTFAVEILDSNGKRVWHGQRLGMGRDYSLNLTLARRMIPAGRYLIKLYGMRDGKQEPVADYPVQISY